MTETLEEVITMSKITFTRDLTFAESDGFIKYLAKKTDTLFNYHFSGSLQAGYRYQHVGFVKEGEITNNLIDVVLPKPPFTSIKLKFNQSKRNNLNFESIQFLLTPNFEIKEYETEGVREILGNIRIAIMDYFIDNPE